MTENPTELLKIQVDLLNRLVTVEENQQKQIEEMIAYQDDHQRMLYRISRAATLYFWLTVIGIVGVVLVLIFNIGVIASLLRILPVFH